MNIKLLPKQFTGIGEVSSFNFTQVYNSQFTYIYKVGCENANYEVFERKNSPVCIDFEKRIYSETEFKETYPKANSFGVWAWTFKSLEKAFEKAHEIDDRITNKIIENELE